MLSKTRLIFCASLCLALVSVTLSAALLAHPHNWIDVKTQFIVDKNGDLSEVLQQWRFDVYYSTIQLSDIAKEYTNQQEGLENLAASMAENLGHYHYFSDLQINQQAVALSKPREASLAKVSDKGQRLILKMRFVLERSKPVKGRLLSLRVFDPTYYIDMKHHQLSQVSIVNHSQFNCTTHLHSPTPSEEMIRYATSLDSSKKKTEGLGEHFAESVTVRCF